MGDALSEIFEEPDFQTANLASPENLFSMMETLDDINADALSFSMFEEPAFSHNPMEDLAAKMPQQDANCLNFRRRCETDEEEGDSVERRKKLKPAPRDSAPEEGQENQPKMSHIAVERNRRKQMNEHLVVLRSLMPCFYVKRGDQASIIGGVVDYIKELQQLLKSLEAKKQRKVYSDVLSPRPPLSSPVPLSSPRSLPPLPPSPCRPSPLCSPRTPQSASPYKPKTQPNHTTLSPSKASSHESSSSLEIGTGVDRQLATNYRSSRAADVEVKLAGPNVLLKAVSHRIPGQALKIITALEGLALEILHVNISTMEETTLFSFTIKIGVECELSAEELANNIRQTFS